MGCPVNVTELRTAAGDASRAAGSMLRSTAANPDHALATIERLTGGPADDFRTPPGYDADRLRLEARRHIAFAVLYMHHARTREASEGEGM